MFNDLIESLPHQQGRSRGAFLVSLVIHGIIILTLLVVPLIYYQALPEEQLLTFLMAAAPPPPLPPAPPPPAAPPPQSAAPVQVVKSDPSKFVQPIEIPEEIPPPMEDLPVVSSLLGAGVPGGVPGGVVPGVPGGLGGVIGSVPSPGPPPPPPKKKEPVRVGGSIQASRLIHRVEPEYPELAKRARVQGIVFLTVTVDEAGNVSSVDVMRGHPLLVPAAVEAVQQWKYSPTLLNGEPVPVIAAVTVNFVLR